MKYFTPYIYLSLYCLLTVSCTIENLENVENIPKSDFSSYNYLLATEDASDVDITTFFAFNTEDIVPDQVYDPVNSGTFINSNPSTSSGHVSFKNFFFSQAKDKKGYSSTPGLYRLTLNEDNRVYIDAELHISRDNLFPARQLCLADEHLGYFYNEGKEAQSIQIFDPLEMRLKGSIDLKPAISEFRPEARWVDEAGNNLVRTGSLVLEQNQGKLYVSVVFLETASFNLIADDENSFYLAVIDIQTNEVEKIIAYEGTNNVGFFVSENKATATDDDGNLYFCSWGWNQFNTHRPSQIFRIRSGETDFDPEWKIDIERLFGSKRIAQSIAVFNGKIYLHISENPYTFSDDDSEEVKMAYYEFDPDAPDQPRRLDIPSSNASSRISVFSPADEKLFICVPNVGKGKFNGLYSVDRDGKTEKEMTIENKYRPTRLYRLGN